MSDFVMLNQEEQFFTNIVFENNIVPLSRWSSRRHAWIET